jgi:hypothetical protein
MPNDFNEVLKNSVLHAPHLKWEISRRKNKRFIEKTIAFLSATNRTVRKTYAMEAIRELWAIWKQEDRFKNYLKNLKKTEEAAAIFDETNRDHLVHSLYVYLLGHYLISICPVLKKYCWDKNKYFLFSWGMASTLHDIAYPLELHSKQITKFIGKAFSKGKKKSNWGIKFDIEKFVEIEGLDTTLWHILEAHLSKEYGEGASIDMERYFNKEIYEQGVTNHGIFGGLFVLKQFAKSFIIHRRGGHKADHDILEISAAIALHDLDRRINIDLIKHPIPYLLVLADELQQWDRPSTEWDAIPSGGVKLILSPKSRNLLLFDTILPASRITDIENKLSNKLSQSYLKIKLNSLISYEDE